jgi:hypothetical protein
LLVCCAAAADSTALLCLAPALLLACLLSAKRYPGARKLVAWSARRRPRARRARSVRSARSRPLRATVHGGLLIACSLAVRPPPVPAPVLA